MGKHGSIDLATTEAVTGVRQNAPEATGFNPSVPGTTNGELPNRLLTTFEVAEFVGCHEETIRRAYQRGLLASQRGARTPVLPA